MLTEEKIKIYRLFNGDIDGWARSGSKKQLSVMTDDDWALIDNFLQDIYLVKKGLASMEFANNLENRLIDSCDNERTISKLKQITAT